MFTLFYESGNHWFDVIANCCVWFLIAAALFFIGWVGYDLVTGPRKQREEVKRMLAGLDTVQDITGVSTSISGAHRPFGPGKRSKQGV